MTKSEAPLIEIINAKEATKLVGVRQRSIQEQIIDQHRRSSRDAALFDSCLSDANGDIDIANTLYAIRISGRKPRHR